MHSLHLVSMLTNPTTILFNVRLKRSADGLDLNRSLRALEIADEGERLERKPHWNRLEDRMTYGRLAAVLRPCYMLVSSLMPSYDYKIARNNAAKTWFCRSSCVCVILYLLDLGLIEWTDLLVIDLCNVSVYSEAQVDLSDFDIHVNWTILPRVCKTYLSTFCRSKSGPFRKWCHGNRTDVSRQTWEHGYWSCE